MTTTHTTTVRLAATTALAALVLLTGACGSSPTSGGDGPVIGSSPTAAPTTPAPTPAPTTAAPTTAQAATTPVADAPPRCTTAELTGSLADGDAGAGSVFRTLVLTNTGSRTCELTGFPGVSYVAGDDGHQVGPAAAMSGETHGQVRLAAGGSAGAALQMVQVAAFDPATCAPVPVRGLRVYPPGDTASLFVPLETTGCSAPQLPGNQISVQAVVTR